MKKLTQLIASDNEPTRKNHVWSNLFSVLCWYHSPNYQSHMSWFAFKNTCCSRTDCRCDKKTSRGFENCAIINRALAIQLPSILFKKWLESDYEGLKTLILLEVWNGVSTGAPWRQAKTISLDVFGYYNNQRRRIYCLNSLYISASNKQTNKTRLWAFSQDILLLVVFCLLLVMTHGLFFSSHFSFRTGGKLSLLLYFFFF